MLLEVELEMPTLDIQVDSALNQALESINRSLDPSLWIDNNNLVADSKTPEILELSIIQIEQAIFSPTIEPFMLELLQRSSINIRELSAALTGQ